MIPPAAFWLKAGCLSFTVALHMPLFTPSLCALDVQVPTKFVYMDQGVDHLTFLNCDDMYIHILREYISHSKPHTNVFYEVCYYHTYVVSMCPIGIACPRAPRDDANPGDAYGQQALMYVKDLIMQREVG